jgi:hypothetical protein
MPEALSFAESRRQKYVIELSTLHACVFDEYHEKLSILSFIEKLCNYKIQFSIVFFKSNKKVELTKEHITYQWENFVADFGGYLGLLLV